jgi:Domain of unknown function (DUF4431)
VYADDAAVRRKLQTFVGKSVRVTGKVFTAHTAHHHAPIVMDVKLVEKPWADGHPWFLGQSHMG